MSRLLHLVGLLALLSLLGFDSASAAKCISAPDYLKKGAYCSQDTPCLPSLYCSNEGVCVDKLKDGESCTSSSQCSFLSACVGEQGKTTCVAWPNPGETCDPSGVGITCPGPTTCDSEAKVCVNGQVGDSCQATSNCMDKLTCVNNVCTPLSDGDNCTSSLQCKPQSYCDENFQKCTPKRTQGIAWAEDACANGYTPLGKFSGDAYSCIAWESRKVGEYCQQHRHCAGASLCYDGKCASKKPSGCTSLYACAYGEECKCSGKWFLGGSGTCGKSQCTQKSEAYEDCLNLNCHYSNLSSKSCMAVHCLDEYNALLEKCNQDT